MDGPRDAKRPRLDHERSSYPPAPVPRPTTTSPSTAAQPRPYPDHPQSAPPNHSYQPPLPGPPPPQAQPAAPGPHRPSSSHPGHDPRGPPVFGPPTSQAGYHEQANGYAVNHTSRSRSFSTDPPPSASSQLPPVEQRGHPLPPAGPERMDLHGQPPHGYQQQLDQHPNHQVPSIIPYAPHEPYSHGYQQSPVSAYAPPHPFGQPGQGPTNFSTANGVRKKQVRAQQACNNCRQRKQKCDEQKPCGYCKAENHICEYKDVPPPKTDRAMSDLKETMIRMERNMDRRLEEMARIIMGNHQNQSHDMAIKSSPSSDTNEDRKIAIAEMSDSSTALSRTTMGPGEYSPEIPRRDEYRETHRQGPRNEPAVGMPLTLTRGERGVVNVQPSTQQRPTDSPDQPHSHETGAQHLMTWPIISKWFEAAGVTQREYIWRAELGQGTLRPYGSSWAVEADDEYQTPLSPPQSADVEHVSMWSEPKEGSWGTEFSRSEKSYTSIGGLNPDGSLCLDAYVIKELWVSYGRNMWVMHPFMDARELRLFIEKFIRKHSPSGHRSRQSPSTRYAVPNSPLPLKRKFQDDESQAWSPPTMTPERSMENAIVLLVLALGRVVQEEGFLLQELPAPSASTPQSYTSSPRGVYTSPRPHGVGSPASAAGRSSTASEKTHSRFKVKRKHTDMYPGSAYFAYASDILGNNKGGNEIIHAQANLLAGLYLMQLGRVVESSSYMNETFRIATILRGLNKAELFDSNNPHDVGGREPMNDQLTIISMLCWSALQLESDLRAELEALPKPPGALMYNEPTVRKPDRLIGTHDGGAPFETTPGRPAIDPNEVLWHYITQINLRLTLNRVHSALYKSQDSVSSKAPWADADASGLFIGLQNFRELIIEKYPQYRWTDGDDLPTDLLQARLRAKFYGAAYIILRPYISNALTYHDEGGGGDFPPINLHTWLKNDYKADQVPTSLPKNHVRASEFQSSQAMVLNYLWCCKKSIDSAMHSTVAFDGVADPVKRQRLRVTNIHGTATAQFSNMLVLTAVYKSWLHPLVDVKQLRQHMDRTIKLHRYLCPLAPIFRINLKVLLCANTALGGEPGPDPQTHQDLMSMRWAQESPHSMHGSQSSMPSPVSHTPVGNPPYGQHRGPNSAHTSFGSH